jgi:hypothetical protein
VLVQPLPAIQLKGAVDGRPYEAQWRAWRCPVPVRLNSVGGGAAVPGAALQWRGWPHRADSDGEDRSRRPYVMVESCVNIGKVFVPFRGFRRPLSRARRASRTKVGGTVPRS